MGKKRSVIPIVVLLMSLLTLLVLPVQADDHTTRSIIGDWFNPVFHISLRDGKGIFDSDEDLEKRKSLNTDIANGNCDSVHSLYDRFGGDISFIPYFGETRIQTGLFDRVYTKLMEENTDSFQFTLSDLKMFMEKSAVSNNVIYAGRPNVLSSDEVNGGYVDPRVSAYSALNTVGGDSALGNAILAVSKVGVSLVAFLSSNGMFSALKDLFEGILDLGLSDLLEALKIAILPMLVLSFLLMLVSHAMKVLKGDSSMLRSIQHTLGCLVSLTLVYTFVASPMVLADSMEVVVNVMDNVFDASLVKNQDEVISSDDLENVREAILWKTVVLEPWCFGMFQRSYEECYTQYDPNTEGHTALPQSNDNIGEQWGDGSVRYNSVQITGDVLIPLGGGEGTRNWAALAWSCQSEFHIQAVNDSIQPLVGASTTVTNESWPIAETTPMNSSIYVDNFRWLDAILNVSPEYRSGEGARLNLSGSNRYQQRFVEAGLRSIFMLLLSVPILVIGFKKTLYCMQMVCSGFVLAYRSVMTFFLPEQYSPLENLKKALKPIADYLWWSLCMFVAIALYQKLAGTDMMLDLLWLVVGVYLILSRPVKVAASVRQMGRKVQQTAGKLITKAKNRLARK